VPTIDKVNVSVTKSLSASDIDLANVIFEFVTNDTVNTNVMLADNSKQLSRTLPQKPTTT